MILVDTSVWIEHFVRGCSRLAELLVEGQAAVHPLIEGELACGNLHDRFDVFRLLGDLPRAAQSPHEHVMGFLHRERLYGQGLSWIDVHLLATCRSAACGLWTLDGALSRSADQLGIGQG